MAAVYGGNASGKSNLFQALNFAKNFVAKGTQPDAYIPVEPFRLDDSCLDRPSRFTFELLIQETVYEYVFSVTRQAVVEEKLTRISSNNEHVLYERHDDQPIKFDGSLSKDKRLEFVFQGTRDNQLF